MECRYDFLLLVLRSLYICPYIYMSFSYYALLSVTADTMRYREDYSPNTWILSMSLKGFVQINHFCFCPSVFQYKFNYISAWRKSCWVSYHCNRKRIAKSHSYLASKQASSNHPLLPPRAAPKNLSLRVPLAAAAFPAGELRKNELPSRMELLPSIPKLLRP